jgi:hypothetical protein
MAVAVAASAGDVDPKDDRADDAIERQEAGDVPNRDRENTGINTRDRDGKNVTVFDQGSSEADREITASIRKAVVDDDTLSTNAHNVKIITIDGVVTLRGPVENAAEKSKVEAKAKAIAGVNRIESQLEVDTD